jgi:hypothetical protein
MKIIILRQSHSKRRDAKTIMITDRKTNLKIGEGKVVGIKRKRKCKCKF